MKNLGRSLSFAGAVVLLGWGAGLSLSVRAQAYIQPRPTDYQTLNPSASSAILYEVQVRAANACRMDTGSQAQKAACSAKISPQVTYNAFGGDSSRCSEWDELKKIKLGTLDDMLEDTSDYHLGITLKYIREKVGANTIWLMPLFPNNDRYDIPDVCDNLGSPYAVRDYMHASGKLDRFCIQAGLDEYTGEDGKGKACWGNGSLDRVIAKAHSMGLKVMLDVAFNHFGHNYLFYDYASYTPVREMLAQKRDLDDLWDFAKTFEPSLVRPEVVDTVDLLTKKAASNPSLSAAAAEVKAKCPALSGDRLVRAAGMWREMLDWERARFRCEAPLYLEYAAPGFYLGQRNASDPEPSGGVGSNFTNNWRDVKFLYHHEYHGSNPGDVRGDYYPTFVRNREYLFRVLNFWVSRGIDGFRFDHTTDPDGGMGPNEWRYLVSKVNHYDWVRKGRPTSYIAPLYLAEEFGDQMGMAHTVDVMTDGYVGDIRGGNGATKDASFVERSVSNGDRFGGHVLVMRALETHDETRLFEHTGFSPWTGAGFWGIGAASYGTPMLLMGQEFGESWGLGFRKSDFLRSRFYETANHRPEGADLAAFYRMMNVARQDPRNRALTSPHRYFLRSRYTGQADSRIFAQVRWDNSNGQNSTVFTFHHLWEGVEDAVEQAYYLPPEISSQLRISDALRYRLVDVFTEQPMGACRTGAELKWELYVKIPRSTRMQWLRLELCP